MSDLYDQLLNSNFLLAAKKGDVAGARGFLEQGARLHVSDRDEKTALALAAENGRAEMVEFLLGRGAEANGYDENGDTPLMLALKNGHEQAALAFLSRDFNLAAKDRRGATVLHLAVAFESVTSLLLEKGADVSARSEQDVTPLMDAAEKNAVGAARLLLQKGADINAQDGAGMTPLVLAVRTGSYEVAEFLLKEGADAAKQTHMCLTAFDIAQMRKDPKMSQLIKQAFEEYDMKQFTEGANHDMRIMHAIKLKR